MFCASAKRLKLVKEKNEYSSVDAESGFHSENDFSSSNFTASKSSSIDNDFVLSPVKRVLATRRASQTSLSSSDGQHHHHQLLQSSSSSSGYSSLLSSSSSNLISNASSSSISRQSRTPKKRKSEISESDENFYNSFQFISPLKIRKKDDKNCAKLILKEKSCSENVILSSTPIRTNTEKWQKFRSFHPEKIKDFGKTFDDDDANSNNKLVDNEALQKWSENSLNISSFNISNTSFNLTSSVQQQQDIPTNLQNLWTDDIKQNEKPHSIKVETVQSLQVCESQEPTQSFSQSTLSSTASERKKYFNGRPTFDILGRLNANHDIALGKILSYLDDESLLSLSHVSKQYRKMIQSNKVYETKRQSYLKATKSIKENKLPVSNKPDDLSAAIRAAATEKKRRKAFTNYNINENHMTLRRKQSPAPQSPLSRFNEMHNKIQSQQNTTFRKCPRCNRPATIKKIKIRHSPRKKKSNVFSLSASTTTSRVQKRQKTFLSKTTIDSFHDSSMKGGSIFLAIADDELSRSPHRSNSSSCESPQSISSSDDMNMTSDETYEYGICGAAGCSYKFCVKCNCKYHPRRQCPDLSPPSPNRNSFGASTSGNGGGGAACTRASQKSLRRLAY